MMTIVFLMSGSSQAFEEAGFQYPKNLIEIAGQPLVQRVIEGVSEIDGAETRVVCLVPKAENRKFHTGQVIQLIRPGTIVEEVNGATGGALCTALLASHHIEEKSPVIIINGDILIEYSLRSVLADFKARNLDGGLVCFNDVHPRWSFVKLGENGLAIEVAEKRPISNLATTGLNYFARGSDFLAAAAQSLMKDAHVDGLFYMTPIYNEMILQGKRVGAHWIPKAKYFSFKAPQDLAYFEERHHEKVA